MATKRLNSKRSPSKKNKTKSISTKNLIKRMISSDLKNSRIAAALRQKFVSNENDLRKLMSQTKVRFFCTLDFIILKYSLDFIKDLKKTHRGYLPPQIDECRELQTKLIKLKSTVQDNEMKLKELKGPSKFADLKKNHENERTATESLSKLRLSLLNWQIQCDLHLK